MVDATDLDPSAYADSGYYTPATLLRKRQLAESMLQQGMQTTPIQSRWQGLARLASAMIGGHELQSLDAQERAQGAKDAALISQMFGGQAQPALSAPAQAPAAANTAPISDANAISGIESGGNYGELGPVTKTGDRAYGKYQVMGANVGPWTKEVLGAEMTPQQFLGDKDAQEKVFASKFGQYKQKYGPEGAARAWFAGEGGMNNPNASDQLGTTVSGYAKKFNAATGAQPSAGASLSPSPNASGVPSMAIAARLAMSGDPRRAAIGNMIIQKGIASDLQMPPELREYAFYQKQTIADGKQPLSFSDWDLQRKTATASKTTINMGENKLKAAVGEKVGADIASDYQGARDAVQSINANNQARELLDQGVITGFGANWKVGLGKALQQVGVNVAADPIANTEAFVAQRAQETGRIIKQFGSGTGLSDADRQYAMKAAAGDIDLNEASIRKILDLNERVSRFIIDRNNANVGKLPADTIPFDMRIEAPQLYKSKEKTAQSASPAQPAQSAKPQYQEGQTGTNPETGEKWIFRNGNWVKANGQ